MFTRPAASAQIDGQTKTSAAWRIRLDVAFPGPRTGAASRPSRGPRGFERRGDSGPDADHPERRPVPESFATARMAVSTPFSGIKVGDHPGDEAVASPPDHHGSRSTGREGQARVRACIDEVGHPAESRARFPGAELFAGRSR